MKSNKKTLAVVVAIALTVSGCAAFSNLPPFFGSCAGETNYEARIQCEQYRQLAILAAIGLMIGTGFLVASSVHGDGDGAPGAAAH